MNPYVLVGIGGALGAMLRYGYSTLAGRLFPSDFPHATLVINVAGSLAMGIVIGLLARWTPPAQGDIRLLVATGILGGFTTFSSFSLEAVTLIERGSWTAALAYVLLSVALAIVALSGGLLLARGAA